MDFIKIIKVKKKVNIIDDEINDEINDEKDINSMSVYKCRKGILKNIINDEIVLDKINDAVIRVNHIVITTLQFIELFYLYNLENNKPNPNIDIDFIDKCIKIVSIKDARGPPIKNGKKLMVILRNFYESEFKSTFIGAKESTLKLNQILHYERTQIITAIENNIKAHFFKRLFHYINCHFDDYYKEELNVKGKERTNIVHELRAEYKQVKNDLISGTKTARRAYQHWITENKSKLLPKKFTKSIPYDVQANPLKYLPFMIHMNNELEKLDKKQFHCFPLRSNIVPKHIMIDTAALLELTMDTGTKHKRDNLKANKKSIWKDNFKINDKIFNNETNHVFDYCLITDGISATIRFVRKDKFEKFYKNQRKINMSNEFKYIDEFSDDVIEDLKKKYILVYVDPGKNNIIYCIDDNGKVFRYTRKQRLRETGRLKNQKTVHKYKKEMGIDKIETKLLEKNSKTTNYGKFKEYVKNKNKVNSELFKYYEEKFLRRMKLRTYINTQKSEAKMINNMKKIYNQKNKKEIMLVYGDCNVGKQMRGIISTPMIGMKRLLKKEFEIINIDEFRTSCLDYRTSLPVKNAIVKIKKGKSSSPNKKTKRDNINISIKNAIIKTKDRKTKKLHSVLVSEIPGSSGSKVNISYLNRDLNAVLNMRKITNYYIKYKKRQKEYCRDYKTPHNS